MSPRLANALALALALLALAPTSGCRGERSFSDGDRQAIAAVLEAQAAAWNAGDLEGFMGAYEDSEDLVFTSGGAIRRGYATTRERYRQRYGDDRSTMGALSFELLEIQPLGADGAIVLGRWRLRETPAAGEGVFSLALRRDPEGWRIVHDHTSAAPAEPVAPTPEAPAPAG
ncbi:MAG: DUF4440 domain-containing protein [Myxococcales bacterium]|nr:DUF4440 domain-containing protein [Myxococcales bacterium]MCB9570372.1 DUF4440 domain-containing protein [Myxococcales bacterium]